ncbi:MAG: protoheme IX farnesyltransferase [Deltaproteobacteria bacterium]|nr:protoheme IX farnesyltransferase [Deltaproteobacteria bacterium]
MGSLPVTERPDADAATSSLARDLVALTKPGITIANVLMTVAGMCVAPGSPTGLGALAAIVGTAAVVGAANTFNMALERRSDATMARTRRRPVAAGRVGPGLAWGFGAALAALGTLVLALGTSPATTLIGLAALVMYTFVYTPLKRVTPWALLIGAVPGAAPPLMGALAVTPDGLAPGLALFLLVALWQLPHFLAIAVRRRDDYARAGIRAWPVVHGDGSARRLTRASAVLLAPAGLLPMALGPVGVGATALVCALGLALAWASWRREGWARTTFVASLLYLPALALGLSIDRLAGLG